MALGHRGMAASAKAGYAHATWWRPGVPRVAAGAWRRAAA